MDAHSLECLDFERVRELLAGCASTELGRARAATLKPANRADLVQRWLRQVDELRDFASQHDLPPMGGVSDIREIVNRCAPPLRVGVEDLASVGRTLTSTHEIASYLKHLPESAAEILHIARRVGDFQSVATRIATVIDDRGEVRDSASPKLGRVRAEIADATARLGDVVGTLINDPQIRRLLQYQNHTFHGDRYVLPLRAEYRGRLQGIIHRTSDSGATIFVEPAGVVELNNRITNLRAEESEEIARLLWDLAHEVHVNADAILSTVDALATLDLIAAKVRMARQFGMVCPDIVDEPRLDVRRARHPVLLDMARRRAEDGKSPENVVPISYRLGEDFDLLIITGPNTGGKTVTLKTVGLLTLMVQAGMAVPVERGSTFGIFRNLHIDIGDEQSMAQSLSTFSAHLKRQLEMLSVASERCLVLIDELGAGTDPEEGAAIGRAILEDLLKRRCRCVVTTHIGALKAVPLMHERAENGCVEFDQATLRPTYDLVLGVPGLSNAINIAERLGMPQRLVSAARRFMSREGKALHAAMEGTVTAKRQAEQARTAAQDAEQAAQSALAEAEGAKRVLERQQVEFQNWVQRVVHLRAGDPVRVRDFDRDGRVVRVRLDLQRAEVDVGAFTVEVPLGDVLPPQAVAPPPRPPQPTMPRAPKPSRPNLVNPPPPKPAPRPQQAAPRRERAGPTPLTAEQAAKLQPGDEVFVQKFHRLGTVARVNLERQVASVSLGLLEVEVPFAGMAVPVAGQPRREENLPRMKRDGHR